jgi:hypothetical protein
MLTPARLQYAADSNPRYARSLGWDKQLAEVTTFLGVPGEDGSIAA